MNNRLFSISTPCPAGFTYCPEFQARDFRRAPFALYAPSTEAAHEFLGHHLPRLAGVLLIPGDRLSSEEVAPLALQIILSPDMLPSLADFATNQLLHLDRRVKIEDRSAFLTLENERLALNSQRASEEFSRFRTSLLHEIEERRMAGHKLAKSEEKLSATLRSIGDGVIACDTTGAVVSLNAAAENLTGWSSSEAEGRPMKEVFRVINAQTRETAENPVNRALTEGVNVDLANHTILIAKNGTEYQIADSCAPIRNAAGTISGAVLVFRDVTESYRQREELRASEQQHRLLVQNLHAGVVVHAPDNQIVLVNEQACKLFGLSLAQMLGRTALDPAWRFVREDETVMPLEEQPAQRVLATRQPVHGLVIGVDRPATEDRIWVLVNAFHELDADGQLRHVVVTFVDITGRKLAEADREKLQAQLNQAQKMESVGRLAGGVAHDFNNMLGVILGQAELAMRKLGENEPLYKSLNEIQKAALHSADLTHQLLAFARKQTVAPKVIDLNAAVERMLKLLRRLIGENIAMAWLPARHLDPVLMDPSQLDQILTNLCINARDAIPDTGKITIETGSAAFDEAYCANYVGLSPGNYLMLSVRDDGSGMDAKILNHIFEPFFTTKESGKGTGLGLATVYGIVKQNNGFINVDSKPGHGTTFTIYLPRQTTKVAPVCEKSREQGRMKEGSIIMLVDDEPTILLVTKMMLEEMGYAVIAAGSPGEAIRLAREHHGRIDLLLTDMVMPEMNGSDLAKKLLSIYPGIRRVFMSGYAADVLDHRGVLASGVRFIQKPFSIEDLDATIRESLDGGTQNKGLA